MTAFFFYDLETSGFSPRYDRAMQFAGQRTDMDLKPIGEPVNVLIKLTDDILPSPSALLVTGITPQQTKQDGITEAEFAKLLNDDVFDPGTITVGFNNVRFDDEFIRHILWRTFYDPYEWAYADNRSRWDLLDVTRLVRALRPDGINWPFVEKPATRHSELVSESDPKILKQIQDDKLVKVPTNKLELLTKANNIQHENAHDALADVNGLIDFAKLIKAKQPKMWDYLLKLRDKKAIAKLVNLDDPQPFVYASGRLSGEFEKTSVGFPIAPGNKPGSVLVYDLRYSPADFAKLSQQDILKSLTASYEERQAEDYVSIPVKELQYNRCPAVAPLNVLDETSQKRLDLNLDKISHNVADLEKNRDLVDKIVAAWNGRPEFSPAKDVEGQLYDSFTPDADKPRLAEIRKLDAQGLADFHPNFVDERLPELLFRYKARNYPKSLSSDEKAKWESYRTNKLQRELPKYMERLTELAAQTTDDNQTFILEEIQLWVESICQ
ncbi:exodeoxyribonuclease I [Candidatus Saccharibacteria bacterium]|nr:exodeoxyribonuclease I [Candidatus Saccharibacteria bacterium]